MESVAKGSKHLSPLEGPYDASRRRVATHGLVQWRAEIPWMSLHFTAAVWASLALCLIYTPGNHLLR